MRISTAAVVGSLCLLSQPVVGLDCKCTPPESCWPSASEWDAFNQTVDGNLIQGVAPGSVCYNEQPNYDRDTCNAIIKNSTADDFFSSHPVAVGNSRLRHSCDPIYPNGTSVYGDVNAGKKGCSLGALPQYVVNVTKATDIQATLKFAKKRNIRVSIKNTGHNGSGRNVGYGSLSIWTHHLKSIEYHETFQPKGSSSNVTWRDGQQAITIGAGVQGRDLFPVLEKHGVVAVTGTSTDVGVVGWATGGGHGFLTGEYGMGADNIIQAEIVTPAGVLITASEYQNRDIFWAIRGGGGSTFGVIVSLTLKAYKVPKITFLGLDITAKNGTSSAAWWKTMAQLHGTFPTIQEQGAKGYYIIEGPPSSSSLSYAGSFFLWDKSDDAVKEVMEPVRRVLRAANGTVDFEITTLPLTSFYEIIEMYPAGGGKPEDSIAASRLIPKRVVRDEPDQLAKVLEEVGSQALAPSDGTRNPSMSGTLTISHKKVHNSLNPAWREAVVHLITEQSLSSLLPAEKAAKIVKDMTYAKLGALQSLAPESGSYINEANFFEPNWQWSFYGPNYARLRNIKEKYDPNGLLWCPQCVGSESWAELEDGSLCRV